MLKMMVDGAGDCSLFLSSCKTGSGVELEVDDVSILDNVSAAKLTELSSSLKKQKNIKIRYSLFYSTKLLKNVDWKPKVYLLLQIFVKWSQDQCYYLKTESHIFHHFANCVVHLSKARNIKCDDKIKQVFFIFNFSGTFSEQKRLTSLNLNGSYQG